MASFDDSQRIEHFERILNTDTTILTANKLSVQKFLSHCKARNLSLARQRTLLDDLIFFARLLKKPFEKCEREDIEVIVQHLNKTKNSMGKPFSGNSKYRKVFALKTFFKFLGDGDTFPKSVSWLNRNNLNYETSKLSSDDILERSDIEKMLKSCNNEFESALVFCLWEMGCRSTEFLNVKIGDIRDSATHFVIRVKTSKIRPNSDVPSTRDVPLIESMKYLRAYLNKHPNRHDKESYLWLSQSSNQKGKQLSGRGLRFILADIGKRAKLGKRVYVHLYRHSAGSRLSSKLSPAVLNKVLGWSMNSRMWKTYLHLNDKQIENELLGIYGIKTEQEKEEKFIDMKKCPICSTENPLSNVLCSNCNRALDSAGAINLVEQMAKMQKQIELMQQTRVRRIAKRLKGIAKRRQ